MREDPGDQRKKRKLVTVIDAPPKKKTKGSSFATLVARAIEEAVVMMHVPDLQLPAFNASELIEVLNPVGEAEEEDASLGSRRRKTVDPPTVNDPQPTPVEKESQQRLRREF